MELTFDDYLSLRVKSGSYQYSSFFILSMIGFMVGFQEIFQSILTKILTNEWNLTETQQMFIGMTFYLGVMLGNGICSTPWTDQLGRKTMLIIAQILSVITMIANSFCQNYIQIIIVILSYGLIFGVSLPITQLQIGEIVPFHNRGRYIVMLQFIYIIGIMYLNVCCIIFLDSFDSGDWRFLIQVNTGINIICLIGCILLLRESPRLYIAQGNFEKGFQELDYMGKKNSKKYEPMTQSEKEQMIYWQKSLMSQPQNKKSFQGLFQGNNLRITLSVWIIFILFNIISCGVAVITPYIYSEAGSSFISSLIAFSSEIAAIILVVLIIDSPLIGGRIKVILYGLFLLIGINIAIYFFKKDFIDIGQVLQRFSMRIVWSSLNALPTESYSTLYRTMGVGFAQGLGKISGSFSSFIVLPLYYQEQYLPFLVIACFSTLTFLLVFTYPVNATQKPLDFVEAQDNEESKSNCVSDIVTQQQIDNAYKVMKDDCD